MKKMIVLSLVAVLFCAAGNLIGQEAKEGTEIKLEKVNYVSAATINFKKELGIPLPGLLTIGVRIEQTAKDLDPVGLVAAGLELKAAETAAGKTASNYKADDVIKRGLDLAVERGVVVELKAVKALLPGQAETLDKAVKVAEASKGESTRANVYFNVHNRHDECLNLYFSGKYVGHSEDGTTKQFRVHFHRPGWFEARCDDDGSVEYRTWINQSAAGDVYDIFIN